MRNVPEAAKSLGVSTPKVWKMIYDGELPFVRVGRAVRLRDQDISSYIERNLTQYGVEKRAGK